MFFFYICQETVKYEAFSLLKVRAYIDFKNISTKTLNLYVRKFSVTELQDSQEIQSKSCLGFSQDFLPLFFTRAVCIVFPLVSIEKNIRTE